ncbi:MAG: polyphosphate kinase 2 family protein [bacterium]
MGNNISLDKLFVSPETKVSLKDFDTEYSGNKVDKDSSQDLLEKLREKLAEMQDKLYAQNRYSVLVIFQGIDASGKDSAVKHIMTGLNPAGVRVNSFKVPNTTELEHDYFWRHYIELPARGMIGVFNRSHYENVLVTKVHPEFILKENLPGIKKLEDITPEFWEKRYKQITRFEKNLYQNGTVIIKFFLHLSKKEQKKRFLERLNDPTKNWKFSSNDVKERGFWQDYISAYESALSNTSRDYAPWFIIPADDKWYARLAIGEILYEQFEALNLDYPKTNDEQKAELEVAKEQLLNENKE